MFDLHMDPKKGLIVDIHWEFPRELALDGALTSTGYVVSVVALIAFLIIAVLLVKGNVKSKRMTTLHLVCCSASIALAFVTSYLKLFRMPWGGSVTLFSMLFIVLAAYWYGPKTGILVGLSYGILQFIQEPYVLSFFQVCCDYILAFAALGVAGFFFGKKRGLLKGYIAAVLGRWLFHSLGGYLYWMSYMPENFPKSLTAIYPLVYNGSYLFIEALFTIILISIPSVKKALVQVQKTVI